MIEVADLTYSYDADGSATALRRVSFQVRDGEIVLCTGRSGCGKSTLLRCLNGLCPHYYGGKLSGRVKINGCDLQELDFAEISQLVGTLFQDPERQFFALNVEDEIVFALEWQGLNRAEIGRRLEEVIARFNLEAVRRHAVSALSEGQKQKVGLAAVTALQCRTVILDEPTANLDPESTAELRQLLLNLKKNGYCILVVDHRHYWLKDAADRVLVLEDGAICAEGGFALLYDEELRRRCGLRRAEVVDRRELMPDLDIKTSDFVVRGQGLSFAYRGGPQIFNDFNFALPPGISVLSGPNGAGKTTLARLIFGLEKPQQGQVEFRDSRGLKPLRLGSIVLQNTDYQLNMRTVFEEIAVCMSLNQQRHPKREEVLSLLSRLDLQDLAERHPQSLSGGQKQRLVIACALAKSPRVMVLDEPTSGLDGANMQRIRRILQDFADAGNAALLITHDLELMDDASFQALRMKSAAAAAAA